MAEQVFVSRASETARLNESLQGMLAVRGRVRATVARPARCAGLLRSTLPSIYALGRPPFSLPLCLRHYLWYNHCIRASPAGTPAPLPALTPNAEPSACCRAEHSPCPLETEV